jgi:hypothetical protein
MLVNAKVKDEGSFVLARGFSRFLAVVLVSSVVCVGEFRVNSRTTYNQTDAAVAMDASGNYLIVWSSYKQDGDSGGVFARRFDSNCREVGGEFQINVETIGNQTDPDAGMYETGGFVVAWHGPGIDDEEDVYARRFNAEAEPLGLEFRVNTLTNKKQRYPRVAVSKTGAFVVVWEGESPEGEDGEWAAEGRLYDSNGAPVGNQFEASENPNCRYPDAAMDVQGNFVVVWVEDGSTKSIMARLYDSQARPLTEAIPISSVDFGSLTRPAVAMKYNGDFVVTWDGHDQLSGMDDIHARAFRAAGTPMGEQFIVNTAIERAQQNPRISMTAEGEFVVVWHGESAVKANGKDVFARAFDAWRNPLGNEVRLSGMLLDEQKCPDVAILLNGNYVAAWQSYGQDGSGYGIFATSSARICPADFSDDGFVNFGDYCILAEKWLATGDSLAVDLIDDDTIDALDLAEFCGSWLSPCQECNMAQ